MAGCGRAACVWWVQDAGLLRVLQHVRDRRGLPVVHVWTHVNKVNRTTLGALRRRFEAQAGTLAAQQLVESNLVAETFVLSDGTDATTYPSTGLDLVVARVRAAIESSV